MIRLPPLRGHATPSAAHATAVPQLPVPWRGRDLAAVAGLGVAGVMVATAVGVAIGWGGTDFTTPQGAVMLLLNGTIPALLPYGYLALRFRPEHRLVWHPGGARAPAWLPALGIGLGVGLVWWVAIDFLTLSLIISALEYEPAVQQQLIDALGAGGMVTAAAVLAIVVIAPVGEEFVFRGVVFLGLTRWLGPVAAAVISSVVFGVIHVQADLGAFAFLAGYALAFGLFACWLVRRWGSLWLAIGAHAASNGVSVLLSVLTGQV